MTSLCVYEWLCEQILQRVIEIREFSAFWPVLLAPYTVFVRYYVRYYVFIGILFSSLVSE